MDLINVGLGWFKLWMIICPCPVFSSPFASIYDEIWNLGWSILVHWLELKQMLLALCSSVLPRPHKCHVNDVITFYALSLGIEECSDKARSPIFPLVGVSWGSLPQHGISTWNVAVSDFSCWLWYRRSWRASSSSQWEVRRGTRDKMLKREERVDPIPLVSERKHLKWQNPKACLRGWMYFPYRGSHRKLCGAGGAQESYLSGGMDLSS